jgi:hypothetical protein
VKGGNTKVATNNSMRACLSMAVCKKHFSSACVRGFEYYLLDWAIWPHRMIGGARFIFRHRNIDTTNHQLFKIFQLLNLRARSGDERSHRALLRIWHQSIGKSTAALTLTYCSPRQNAPRKNTVSHLTPQPHTLIWDLLRQQRFHRYGCFVSSVCDD